MYSTRSGISFHSYAVFHSYRNSWRWHSAI